MDRQIFRPEAFGALADGSTNDAAAFWQALDAAAAVPDSILELKNIAVEPAAQGRGYGKALVDFLIRTYKGQYAVLQVGTGDSPSTIPFYESCGFRRHHLVRNFFTDHYDHPIYECGVQLVDMVYLQREL